jgi:hypothetical protein
MPRKSRGTDLDGKLQAVLAEMLSLGLVAAPISRTALQKRLALKSRSTFVGKRAAWIESARVQQLQDAGREPDKQRYRRSLEHRLEAMARSARCLQSERDSALEYVARLILLMESKGIRAEELMVTASSSQHPEIAVE